MIPTRGVVSVLGGLSNHASAGRSKALVGSPDMSEKDDF